MKQHTISVCLLKKATYINYTVVLSLLWCYTNHLQHAVARFSGRKITDLNHRELLNLSCKTFFVQHICKEKYWYRINPKTLPTYSKTKDISNKISTCFVCVNNKLEVLNMVCTGIPPNMLKYSLIPKGHTNSRYIYNNNFGSLWNHFHSKWTS